MSEVADRDDAPRDVARRDGASADDPGLKQIFAEQFSFEKAVGGPREMIEAVVPMTLFSVVYGLHATMLTALVAAVVPSAVFVLWRLVARQPLTHALSGLVGIAIGAGLALWTGRAENFILPSLIKNSVQAVLFGVSALTPWPILGFVIGLMRGEGFDWADRPDRVRAYQKASAVWAGMFVLRLAVQIPLWLAGAAAVLGLANVVLGLPLFAAVLWLTWAIVREPGDASRPLRAEPEAEPA